MNIKDVLIIIIMVYFNSIYRYMQTFNKCFVGFLKIVNIILLFSLFFGIGIHIVSTGGIRWILWFSVRYAAARTEIFGVKAL